MTLLDKTNTLVIDPAFNEQDSIVSVIEEIKATGFPFVVPDTVIGNVVTLSFTSKIVDVKS
jgi:hypothetical protein